MSLIIYPHAALKQIAQPVTEFGDALQSDLKKMLGVLNDHRAIGVGANMCNILKRIIVVDVSDDANLRQPMTMINPQITYQSDETHTMTEASLSIPGVQAEITRPKLITVSYQDQQGTTHEYQATGFIASVIQHEIDYLNGIIYLDYLPKTKAKLLKDKSMKYSKKIVKEMNKPQHKHQGDHTHYHNGVACHHKH